MFDPNDITEKEDGSCDIFCETIEKQAHVRGDYDAIVSVTPPSQRKRGEPVESKPVVSIINVKAPKSDVIFGCWCRLG